MVDENAEADLVRRLALATADILDFVRARDQPDLPLDQRRLPSHHRTCRFRCGRKFPDEQRCRRGISRPHLWRSGNQRVAQRCSPSTGRTLFACRRALAPVVPHGCPRLRPFQRRRLRVLRRLGRSHLPGRLERRRPSRARHHCPRRHRLWRLGPSGPAWKVVGLAPMTVCARLRPLEYRHPDQVVEGPVMSGLA